MAESVTDELMKAALGLHKNDIVTSDCGSEKAALRTQRILKLRAENAELRRAASALWDGITDLLEQSQVDRIERLYREELALLLGDEP